MLLEYARESGGLALVAPLDIVLTEYDVVQPDVVFFLKERRHLLNMLKATRVPPDLAVEVVSRSTERRDRGQKMELLARFGVPEYWIVDPLRNSLEIYALKKAGYELVSTCHERGKVASPTLKDLTFDVHQVLEA